MDSFSLYRDRIGQTLAQRLADAIGQEVVTIDEGSEIARSILDGVQGARNHKELVNYIEELARAWPLFGPVLVAEQSQIVGAQVEQEEKQAVSEVENLLKENRIDEAIATAEQATHNIEEETSTLPPPFNVEPQPTQPATEPQTAIPQESLSLNPANSTVDPNRTGGTS